nr:zinc finger, CCHC-type [Tanacetum cinerariifolium]
MLHMKEDETIDAFTTKLTTLVNKAASLGHTMKDETLVRKLLNDVPDRYLQIVALIEQYSDLSEMTLEEAIGRLKTYEERIKVLLNLGISMKTAVLCGFSSSDNHESVDDSESGFDLIDSSKDFKHTLKQKNEELTLIELDSHLRIKESLEAQDNDKSKGNNFVGPSVVNMVEQQLHQDCYGGKVGNKTNRSGTSGSGSGSTNTLKGQNMNSVSGSVLNSYGFKQVIESDKFVLIKHAFMSTSKLNDSALWHAGLGHEHFKRMQDMSKEGLILTFYMDTKKFLEGYTDASWIIITKDNSSTSSWVFLLRGCVISWASKKHSCITNSTMESDFVTLAAACKEAE